LVTHNTPLVNWLLPSLPVLVITSLLLTHVIGHTGLPSGRWLSMSSRWVTGWLRSGQYGSGWPLRRRQVSQSPPHRVTHRTGLPSPGSVNHWSWPRSIRQYRVIVKAGHGHWSMGQGWQYRVVGRHWHPNSHWVVTSLATQWLASHGHQCWSMSLGYQLVNGWLLMVVIRLRPAVIVKVMGHGLLATNITSMVNNTIISYHQCYQGWPHRSLVIGCWVGHWLGNGHCWVNKATQYNGIVINSHWVTVGRQLVKVILVRSWLVVKVGHCCWLATGWSVNTNNTASAVRSLPLPLVSHCQYQYNTGQYGHIGQYTQYSHGIGRSSVNTHVTGSQYTIMLGHTITGHWLVIKVIVNDQVTRSRPLPVTSSRSQVSQYSHCWSSVIGRQCWVVGSHVKVNVTGQYATLAVNGCRHGSFGSGHGLGHRHCCQGYAAGYWPWVIRHTGH